MATVRRTVTTSEIVGAAYDDMRALGAEYVRLLEVLDGKNSLNPAVADTLRGDLIQVRARLAQALTIWNGASA